MNVQVYTCLGDLRVSTIKYAFFPLANQIVLLKRSDAQTLVCLIRDLFYKRELSFCRV